MMYDANDLGPGIDGPLNLLTGVCFHQHRHIEAMREIEQRLEMYMPADILLGSCAAVEHIP